MQKIIYLSTWKKIKKRQLVHVISLLRMSHCDTGKERCGEDKIQLSFEVSAYYNLYNYLN